MRRVVKLGPILIFFAAFGAGMSIYLSVLYRQLNEAFHRREQFVPTRVYSDVTRIAPPQSRAFVEERLKSLGYHPSGTNNTIQFTLHEIDYPLYLIPSNHPQLDPKVASEPVVLQLSPKVGALPERLLSVQIGGKDVPDVYLEPELVTSLSSTRKEIRELVKFQDIPAPVWKAIIAIEDQHFLEHKGLDPRGIARAVWVNIRSLRLAQGGSTLTQQLVKNLMARRNKNVFRKINELFLSLLLEATYDKEQILERYLNEVYLGQVGNMEVHGVAEGAEHFFGKNLNDLNLAEIALMAGLIRGPGYYSPYKYPERAYARERLVLKKMVETGKIAEGEAQAALSMPIRLLPAPSITNKAPYFADFVKAELYRQLQGKMSEQEIDEAGFRVYTTLDLTLNEAAQLAVSHGIAALEKKVKVPSSTRLEGALASVDPSNGYVRALIGGRSYAQSNFNRILNMQRQVGSTFKPVVYLTAYLKGHDPSGVPYGPGYPINDAPWTLVYDNLRQHWTPRDYEDEYLGWITLRQALAHSINTSTARLGYQVGFDEIIKVARALGIGSPLPSVPSISLGIAELSPIELVRMYATIANHGIANELTVFRGITKESDPHFAHFVEEPKQVVDAANIDLLRDTLTSVFTEGTAHETAVKMGFDRPAAGKTGTTSHHRDAWFAGFTPQLATVVWTGLDQPTSKSKANLTGAVAALPIWIDFMKTALSAEPVLPFPENPSLTQVRIDRKSGLAASAFCPGDQVIEDEYVRGNEPANSSCATEWPSSPAESVAP
ncbi:MAG: PBP1A family penicillin-binding protein [Oligoflexia bacterium]|nr:PBP1A family penicillin-binding protein [Oligoflexia bacterium]